MTYGVKIVSDAGREFILPQDNPMIFYGTFIPGGGIVDLTNVPWGTRVEVFGTSNQSGPAKVELSNVSGYTRVSTSFYQIWVFCNREFSGASPSYGLKVFDKDGNVAFTNESKPLKIYSVRVDQLPITPGGGIAAQSCVHRMEKVVVGQMIYRSFHTFCDGSSISNQDFFLGTSFGSNYVFFDYPNMEILYIKISEYS